MIAKVGIGIRFGVAWILEPPIFAKLKQLERLLTGKAADPTQLVGEYQRSTVGVEHFRQPKRFFAISFVADRSVVRKDDRIGQFDER